jgi:hypothetical protein
VGARRSRNSDGVRIEDEEEGGLDGKGGAEKKASKEEESNRGGD